MESSDRRSWRVWVWRAGLHALQLIAGSLIFLLPVPAEAASLKFDVLDKVGWRGDRTDAVPASVEETYSYDEAADTITIAVKFDKKGFAPLPPMLALAAKYGFPVKVAGSLAETSHKSVLGPLMGVEGADGYTYAVKGLGKYVLERPALGAGKGADKLQKMLEGQVRRILDAGHLAPWLFLVNVPGSGSDDRGDVYWHNPAETLYLLAELAPLLSLEVQDALKKYLKTERESFPPEAKSSVPIAEGARREYCSPDKKLLKRWEDKTLAYRTKAEPGIWNLYGLARYYEATGDKPSQEVMGRAKLLLSRSMERRDWATLYWFRDHTPAFNAVHGANQVFAGLIGTIRLARMVGDKEAEALGWGLFARTAALRFAMGKYTQYMQDAHLFNRYYDYRPGRAFKGAKREDLVIQAETDPARYEIPKDPAWWVKQRNNDWMGELVTWNWSKPIDNVRQVHRLDETGVDVWEWSGVDCGGTGQKRDVSEQKDYWYARLAPYLLPFRDMVPELGRFMADHLKAEAEAYCGRVVENQPHWHITYAEAILSAEDGFNSPSDAYGQFLARAWVLGEKPEQLERCLDVPWLKVGDLYYLHKLAETIKAFQGVQWRRMSRQD